MQKTFLKSYRYTENIYEILQVWKNIPEILQSIWKTFLKSYGYKEIIADEKLIKRKENKTVEGYKKISEMLRIY